MKIIRNILICFAALYSFAFAQGLKIDVGLSPVGSFEIEANRISGSVVQKDGKFYTKGLAVMVRSLNSGIDLRDNHMKEKLEMSKHARITVTKAIGAGGKGKGEIEVKGIRKPFQFTYDYNQSSKMIDFKFDLSLKEFNISGISYKGIGVEDIVKISGQVPVKN